MAPRKPLLAACNTVVTSDVGEAFAASGVPVWSLVWELATSIDASFGEQSFLTAMRSARRTTVASDHCRQTLVQRFGAAPESLLPLLIGMPCDPDTLPERRRQARLKVLEELGLDDSAFLVMGCGSIHHRKGTDLFVQAAIEALRGPGSDRLYFLWIGADQLDATFRSWCEHDRAAAGHNDRIFLLGQREQPAEYYAAADTFVLSSREDPYPRVVLEAMAHGLPVVAFEGAGGAPEALTNGAGITVPYLDVGAMGRELVRLAEAPRYREQISRGALNRMTSDLSPEALQAAVLGILTKDFGYDPGQGSDTA